MPAPVPPLHPPQPPSHLPSRSDFAEATRRRLEEAARRKEEEEREKAAQRYQRREYRTGRLTGGRGCAGLLGGWWPR